MDLLECEMNGCSIRLLLMVDDYYLQDVRLKEWHAKLKEG